MALADEKYLSFTTFKTDGTPRPLPIWIVDAGNGKLGFTTYSTSYKVRRLANDPRCIVQPCDVRGNVLEGTEPAAGTAVAHQAEEFERIRSLVKGKYGIQFTLTNAFGAVRRLFGKDSGTDTAIIITLDE